MNLLDAIILAVAALFTIRGIFRGFVREIASLAGIFVGFAAATLWYQDLTPWVAHHLGLSPGPARLTAFVLILATLMVAIHLAAYLLRAILRLAFLGWLDRLAGAGLGFLKAAVLASMIVLVLTAFLPPQAEILATSRLVPLINTANAAIVQLLPKELRQAFEEGKAALDRVRTLSQTIEEMFHAP